MSLLILDNYDSFTYNLVELIRQCGYGDFEVFRNDEISLSEIARYDHILLSPGPGLPSEAGITCDVIRELAGTRPILGVCLGLQAIAEVFGAKLFQLESVCHGLVTELEICDPEEVMFQHLTKPVKVGLYHSWAVSHESLPEGLSVTALSTEGVIMGLRHRRYDVHGLQFHPESIMTPEGVVMMKNWLFPG